MTHPRFFHLALCLGVLLAGSLPAAADVAEDAAAVSAAAEPSYGFNAPTFMGDWRFRVKLNGFLPTRIPVDIYPKSGGKESDTFTLDFILENLKYYIPIDGEVRKGSFGFFAHTLFFKIEGDAEFGPNSGVELKWDDHGFLIDVGISYELGTWKLGDGAWAPELTLEPFVAYRLFNDPVKLDLDPFRFGADTVRFSSYAPIVGLRTFWDFGDHWNVQAEGDYGGFGVDDNHRTFQGIAMLGYRWKGWGVTWNLQGGYRWIQFFDLRRAARVVAQARGPQVSIGVDF